MKLDVPFIKQTTNLNCGPVALKMILDYFGANADLQILKERTGIREDKGITTLQIAIAAKLSGFETEFFSKQVYFNEENLKLDFYKRYSDEIQKSEELVERAREFGVKIFEREIELREILGKLNEKCIPIVLIDWNVIKLTNKDYQGHFVPIVGYDDEFVYVHNQGFDNPMPFFPIRKEVFEKARKAKGTDEDVIFIKRD